MVLETKEMQRYGREMRVGRATVAITAPTTTPNSVMSECEHKRTETIKRARDTHEVETWESKIIEKCRVCGDYILT